LIIEDNEAFSKTMGRINIGMGFRTLFARTGREGLGYMQEYKIDGILLDLMLPDMSGIDILREIKTKPQLRNIPIHIISSRDKGSMFQGGGDEADNQNPMEEDIVEIIYKILEDSQDGPKNLLVVDDNDLQIKSIQKLIENQNIIIKTVENEEEAKHEIDSKSYDALILDLELREGSGTNICRHLKEKNPEVPVIIYTGKDLSLEQEIEIKKYADSIIIKTANSDERLLDEVTLFLHRVRKREQDDKYLVSRTNRDYALRLDGKRILIADDDPRNIFVLASALEDHGAEIIEAESGEAALRRLKERGADLVLMDIMMPHMDGFEAIAAIRQDKDLADIPIIAVTAKPLKEDREKCIRAGANDYISKPVDYDVLIRLIKAWINK